MNLRRLISVGVVAVFFPSICLAQHDDPALPDDSTTMSEMLSDLADGNITIRDLRRKGLEIFTTSFNTFDGYGDGPYDHEVPKTEPGHRPTLQGNGLTLRVNGLDAQSCNECHSFVRRSTTPPVLGIGGVGGIVQNALISPTVIDVTDAAKEPLDDSSGSGQNLPLTNDGVADFNGRYANPPFLFGGGGVELLAKEMTHDLQQHLNTARSAEAGAIIELVTHGVDFGYIESLGDGDVTLNVDGIGFKDNSTRTPEEVLVVRPFGRKGENFSMRDFDRVAMQFHFGLQPVEVVGEDVDEDADGIKNEVTEFEMSALHVFDVTNPVPVVEELGAQGWRGFTNFVEIGCNECHTPVHRTRTRYLPLSYPEIPEDPWQNVYMEVDLVEVGFEPVPGEEGVFVPLFADLKRHNMGSDLAETFDQGEIPNTDFTTARLWGIADTAPYLHDGRATTLRQAILLHGGEAQEVRDSFAALRDEEQAAIIDFLSRLRTPAEPNEELLDTSSTEDNATVETQQVMDFVGAAR